MNAGCQGAIMRLAARRTTRTLPTAGGLTPSRGLRSGVLQALLIAALSLALFALVAIYANALRDPRYLDGWVLAGGMALQLYFHVTMKRVQLSPKAAARWRRFHILLGYTLIAVFISHANFSLPDTGLEWALWLGFVLIALSGVFGTYIAWSLKAKHAIGDSIALDRIPARREELARLAHAAATRSNAPPDDLALPAPPYEAWILDLYANHLREFFDGPRHSTAHFLGSRRPLERLMTEIDALSRYVDPPNQETLATIRDLVSEKERLDFARVHLGLARGWLLVHVPVTYALTVLTVLHVVVVYAFSSGAW